MKLYTVTIEQTHRLVVAAQTAERLAEEALDEWDYDDEPDSFANAVPVKSVADLPGMWDRGCIPWGRKDAANPDKTIGEFLEEAEAKR